MRIYIFTLRKRNGKAKGKDIQACMTQETKDHYIMVMVMDGYDGHGEIGIWSLLISSIEHFDLVSWNLHYV